MTKDASPLERSDGVGSAASTGRALVLEQLGRAELSGTSVGIVHLDVDRFHRINARFGQVVGNEVLEVMLDRLERELPPGALVVAVDGDAFIAVLPAAGADATRTFATTLLDVVRRPLVVAEQAITAQASAGIAWRTPGDRPIDLVEHAFLACRRAKATAPGTVVGYEIGLAAEADRRQRIEDGLRRAIALDELVIHVQPEIRGTDGAVIGVEALVRWQHPIDGLLPPAQFLPDAEAVGLMVEIGDWVLDHAIVLASRWATLRDGAPVRVWVNLAAQQLEDGDRLCSRMRRALDHGVIEAASIGFEVTESSLLEDLPSAVGVLMSLRGMGFEISLDDFGTGYSSLTYLRQLPVTAVKIDRQFVAGIRSGSLADEAIVEAVIDLSHALGLSVVAEGIEDADQAERLITLGADSCQGYHFSRPGPPDEIEPLICLPWCGVGAPHGRGVDGDEQPSVPSHPSGGSARSRLFLAALDAAHDAIMVTAAGSQGSIDQPIVYVNAAFESETGFAPGDVIGHSIDMIFADPTDPDLLAWFADRSTDVGTDSASSTIEMPNRRADGSVFLCETTVSPILDERGFLTNWLHVRRDLTKRRAAEGDRARFQSILEQTNALVFIAETGGRWVYVNDTMRRVLGIPLDASLEGVMTQNALPLAVLERVRDEVLPVLAVEGTWTGDLQLVHSATGETIELVSDVQIFEDPLRPGTTVFAAVSRDVTATKRLERADVRRRELDRFTADFARRALNQRPDEFLTGMGERLHALGELLPVDLVYLDGIDLGAGVLRPLSGWRRHAPVGPSSLPKEVPIDQLPTWIEQLSRTDLVITSADGASAEPKPWRDELARVFPQPLGGKNVYASLRVDGELLGVLGLAAVDATVSWTDDELAAVRAVADTLANQLIRARSAVALSTSEARYAAMLTNIADVLVVLDRDGWIRYANPSIEHRLGHPVESVIGIHFLELVHPDDQELAVERFTQTLAEAVELPVTELRVMRADGTSVWCDVDTFGVYDPVIGGFMLSLRDVSAQRAVLESTARQAEHERFVVGLSRWAIEVESDDMIHGLHVHLEHLARMLGTDSAFAALINGDRVRNVAGWSVTGDPDDYSFPAGDARVPAVVARYRTLEPLVVDDIFEHDEPWAAEWRAFPVPDRSGLNMPLVSEGRCLGNLGVAMIAEPRAWTDDDSALVERVSAVVSTLLARLQVEDSLRMSQTRLNALLDGSHDLVVVVDNDGVITYANRAVQRALGYELSQVIGVRVSTLMHPDDLAEAAKQFERLQRGDRTGGVTLRLIAADGSVGHWEITSGRMRDPIAGGRVFTCRDVGARVAADAQAATWMDLLRHAFDIAQRALDIDSNDFFAELPELCSRLGELLDVDVIYLDRVDEASRSLINVAGWSADHGEQVLLAGHALSFDALPEWIERLRNPEPIVLVESTSTEPWAVAKRKVLGASVAEIAISMSAAGELFGVLGVAVEERRRVWSDDEVTFVRIVAETIAHVLERARLDTALRTSESRFRLLSENAADVVLLVDSRGRITYASPSSKALLGYTPVELMGVNAMSLTNPDDAADSAQQRERLLASGDNTAEIRLVRADGTTVWVANSASTVIDPETGGAVEFRISLRDITDRKRLEQQLEWQVLHDPLTGLANRILLRRQLDLAVARRARPNNITVLLVDLDGFKEVNDTYGHAVGDEVLRALSQRFTALTRPTDTLARTGGDEFVLLCPETDADGGVALANRIIEAARTPIQVGDTLVSLGASVGVAHRPDGDADPDMLLIEADHAMYVAKRAGRSTVRVADPTTGRVMG